MNRLIAALLLVAAGAWAEGLHPGVKVSDFALTDLAGKSTTLLSSREVTAVVFISAQCPISNAYNDRMSALYRQYDGKGVRFLFVNSNANEPAAEIVEHSKQAGFPFVVYRDADNHVADHFGAMATPEAYLIDREGVLRYHGYIDDSTNPARAKNAALKSAIDALLAGKDVARGETKAFGCTIKRGRRATSGS